MELYKKQNSINLNEAYALKKEKVNKLLNNYEIKREEKNRKYFDEKRKKEEKMEKNEKYLIMQRTMKIENNNKNQTERLRKAIEFEESLSRKRLEDYNQKLSKFNQRELNKSLLRNEIHKQEQLKRANSYKAFIKKRKKNEEQLEEAKKRYMDKIAKINERYELNKKNRYKIMEMRNNKMYIFANNASSDYIRNIAKDNYLRKEKLEKINKKMNKIDQIRLEKQYHSEERKKKEIELNGEKEIMLKRLEKFLHSDKNYRKQDIYKYVFDGKKPIEEIEITRNSFGHDLSNEHTKIEKAINKVEDTEN